MAQETLPTFEAEIGGVTLVPGAGGVFEVRVDGAPIWSSLAEGRFPDIKALKQLVCDRVAPEKWLAATAPACSLSQGGAVCWPKRSDSSRSLCLPC